MYAITTDMLSRQSYKPLGRLRTKSSSKFKKDDVRLLRIVLNGDDRVNTNYFLYVIRDQDLNSATLHKYTFKDLYYYGEIVDFEFTTYITE